jgi:hypothetical protein
MAQRTLAAPPLNPILQEWIASHAGSINRIASTLGIPAGALASAPAEEASHIISAVRGKNKYYPSQNLTDFSQDNIVPPFIWHEYYADDYADRAPDIVSGEKPPTKSNWLAKVIDYIRRPTKNDVGWGNVNIGSAILYLNGYLSEVGPGKKYEDDPLNLGQYRNNYRKLVFDLVDPQNDLTFKIAGLVIKQADDVFGNLYRNQYQSLPEDQQAALLATAYKQGVPRIINNFRANPDVLLGVIPTLSNPATGDGGPFTLFNYPTIKNLLNRLLRSSGALDPAGGMVAAEASNARLNLPGQGANSAASPVSGPWSGSWGGAGDQRSNAVRYPSFWPPSPDVRPGGPNLAEPSQGVGSFALRKPHGDVGSAYGATLDSSFASQTSPNAAPIGGDFLSMMSAELARINAANRGADGDTVARSAMHRPYPWLPNWLMPQVGPAAHERFALPLWDGADQRARNAAAPLPPAFRGFMPAGFESSFGPTRSNDGGQDISGSAGRPSDPTMVTADTPWAGAYTSSMAFDPWNQTRSYAWPMPSSANDVLSTVPEQSPSWLQSAMPSGPIPESRGILDLPAPTEDMWDPNIPSWWRANSW